MARLQNVDEKTVRNIAAADKEHSAEIPHLSDAAKEKHRELASPPAENWAGEGREMSFSDLCSRSCGAGRRHGTRPRCRWR